MRHSDIVLKTVLTLAGRQDLVVAAGIERVRRQLLEALETIDRLPRSSV